MAEKCLLAFSGLSQLLQQRRLLQSERRRNGGTPFSRSVEVLQRHERSVDAYNLRRHRVVEWERNLNTRIMHSVTCKHVRNEMLYARIKVERCHFPMGCYAYLVKCRLVWRAATRDFNRFAVCAVYCAIAVAGA